MELPIYIDGVQEGNLTLERERDCALVRVTMRDVGRVVRLWLYGEGAFYLGIPEPEQGQLVLCRSISGRELENVPTAPVYAAEKPMEEAELPFPNPTPGRHIIWQGGRAYYF